MNKKETPNDTIFFIFYYTPFDISYGFCAGFQSKITPGNGISKNIFPKMGILVPCDVLVNFMEQVLKDQG
jgi:hypothetical protein